MSCTRSNSAFANKIKKRLREKINADLPAAYPRAFTWAVYGADGSLIVRRSQDDSSKDQKIVDLPEGGQVSAANLGTALSRLLEAAMGFANTVTSGSDSSADIVHVAGSKFLFTAARFGAGFVLAFFSSLSATDSSAPASQGASAPAQHPAAAGKTEASSTATEEESKTGDSASSAKAVPHVIDDEDIVQSTFGGDEPLRKLLTDLNYILTDVRVSGNASTPARRTSLDESATSATAASQQPGGSSPSIANPTSASGSSPDSRARHKSQMH